MSSYARKYRAEVVTDEKLINPLNALSITQALLIVHILYATIYGTLTLHGDIFFDFVGMRNWWCSVLALLTLLEAGAFILYMRQTREILPAYANANRPSYVVGKPMIAVQNYAILSTFVLLISSYWITAQYVASGKIKDGLVGEVTNVREDEATLRWYQLNLVLFLIVCGSGLQNIGTALVAHCTPLSTLETALFQKINY